MGLDHDRSTWQGLIDKYLVGTDLRTASAGADLQLYLGDLHLKHLDPLLQVGQKKTTTEWQAPVIPTIFPTAPRGEPRERIFTLAVRDSTNVANTKQEDEHSLAEKLKHEGADERDRVKRSALLAVYRVPRLSSQSKKEFFHPVPGKGIPIHFGSDKYKLFTGQILFTMLQRPAGTGSELDAELTERILALILNPSRFLLDQTLGNIVKNISGAQRKGNPSVAGFISRVEKRHENALETFDHAKSFTLPHWDLEGLARYQEDLRTILAARLPKLEAVRAVMFTTYLHLWLRFYRTAFALQLQGDAFTKAMADGGLSHLPVLLQGDSAVLSQFAGQLRFRWNTGRFRSVTRGDDAAVAFRNMHAEALGHLPYHLVAIRHASRIVRSLGGPPITSYSCLASWLHENKKATDFDNICRALLLFYHQFMSNGTTEVICEPGLGLWELRELVRGSVDLARHYKTVADYIMPRTAEGLSATQGSVTYFQVGSQTLFWLAKFITRNDSVPLREFLSELSIRYGLAPQDRHERDLLVKSLAEMNLFTRYADAGESHYVQHIL